MDKPRKLRVFLCYGLQDEWIVSRIHERLLREEEWIDPWLVEENLLVGQNRELKLEEALKSMDLVLLCLSSQSLEQEGSFQREINLVVDLAKEKPEGSIFVIPILLDDCEMPQILQSRQPVKFSGSEVALGQAYERIYRSMRTKFELMPGKTVENPLIHKVRPTQSEVFDDLADLTFGGFSFVKIPKGKFIMGSRASNNLSGEDEHPQRPYEIPYNYWITCFPVSNEQFSEYAVSTRHRDVLPKDWKKKLDQPIVNVSWHEVVEYTKWLNKIFKKEIPNGLVFRLPTEAEWERASRGDLGGEWPWGNESLDNFLNSEKPNLLEKLKRIKGFDNNKTSDNFGEHFINFSRTNSSKAGSDPEKLALDWVKMNLAELRNSMNLADVNIFSPVTDSPHDIADMMGSVWEWTQSLYKLYPYDVDDGREDLAASGERAIRGSFMSRSERFSVRSAKRGRASPDRKEPCLGFRIVVAPPVS